MRALHGGHPLDEGAVRALSHDVDCGHCELAMTATRVIPVRPLPRCGHRRLMECPLSTDDWQQVLDAYLAFLHQCRAIAARAHAREALSS
jgi:hypothetical protein